MYGSSRGPPHRDTPRPGQTAESIRGTAARACSLAWRATDLKPFMDGHQRPDDEDEFYLPPSQDTFRVKLPDSDTDDDNSALDRELTCDDINVQHLTSTINQSLIPMPCEGHAMVSDEPIASSLQVAIASGIEPLAVIGSSDQSTYPPDYSQHLNAASSPPTSTYIPCCTPTCADDDSAVAKGPVAQLSEPSNSQNIRHGRRSKNKTATSSHRCCASSGRGSHDAKHKPLRQASSDDDDDDSPDDDDDDAESTMARRDRRKTRRYASSEDDDDDYEGTLHTRRARLRQRRRRRGLHGREVKPGVHDSCQSIILAMAFCASGTVAVVLIAGLLQKREHFASPVVDSRAGLLPSLPSVPPIPPLIWPPPPLPVTQLPEPPPEPPPLKPPSPPKPTLPPHSPALPPPWPPQPPPSPPPIPVADAINVRFHTSPYGKWPMDGRLADAGLLVHMFDGWEDGLDAWAPAQNGPGATDMSASLVFSEQQAAGGTLPLFGSGSAGIIFRPWVTRIKCAKAVDSAGLCGNACPGRSAVGIPWDEGFDKLCTWRAQEVGIQLHRVTDYQKRWQRSWCKQSLIHRTMALSPCEST